MSNHGYIKSRRGFTVPKITGIIHNLNNTIFKGCLTIEHQRRSNGDQWEITCEEIDRSICFWINDSKSLEVGHRNNMFMSWVVAKILNDVALTFKGRISDDGCEGSWSGSRDYCMNFREYLRLAYICFNEELHDLHMQSTPEAHRFDFKELKLCPA